MRARRSLWAIGIAALASARPAFADDKLECIQTHAEGQRMKNRGQFHAAREEFASCMRETCPAPIARECAGFLEQLDAVQPSIVIEARDATGHDLAAVTVRVDGKPVADRLTGSALPIDPGEHDLRFEANGQVAVDHVVVREGAKDRRLSVTFPTPGAVLPPPPAAPPVQSRPTLAWVLGGVGVAAIAPLAIFGSEALSKGSSLRTTCPRGVCSQSDIDAMHLDAVIADVSLGVSVVSVGVAAVLLLTTRGSSSPRSGRLPSGPSFVVTTRHALVGYTLSF